MNNMKKVNNKHKDKKLKKKGIIIVLNSRGSTVAGNNILIAMLLLLVTIGFLLVGGVMPGMMGKNTTGQTFQIVARPPEKAQDSLQMQTFGGITNTPVPPPPTPTPCAPSSIPISLSPTRSF